MVSNPGTKSRIFNSLPERVQSAITAVAVAQAIAAYAESAELSPDVVITFAIAHFLELESIPVHNGHSHAESDSILDELPPSLRTEILNYAAEDDMPPEFVVELAISYAGAVGNRSLSRSRLNDI